MIAKKQQIIERNKKSNGRTKLFVIVALKKLLPSLVVADVLVRTVLVHQTLGTTAYKVSHNPCPIESYEL